MTAPLFLNPAGSLYERIGPEALALLVSRFYGHVAQHPELGVLFPADLSLTAEKQLAFLTGFLGGPPLYHERFGHPRLRARHTPFVITPQLGQTWLACLNLALRETPEIAQQDALELYLSLSRVAMAMVNTSTP